MFVQVSDLAQRSIQTMITLRSDVREMLVTQAEAANMTRSEYIERLILEEHFKQKYGISHMADTAPEPICSSSDDLQTP